MVIMKNIASLFFSTAFICIQSAASDLQITDMIWYDEGSQANRQSYCIFTVKWNNAWNTPKNHDAAWIFLKFIRPGTQSRHAFVAKDGVKIITDHTAKKSRYDVTISNDQTGFFIWPGDRYRGNVHLTIRVNIDKIKTGTISANTGITLNGYGLEMVHIPAGSFYEGEPDSALARQFHCFYLADAEGNHAGLFEMKNEESEIPIGKNSLHYSASEPQYQGDMKGTISKDFPKGVRSFYCMKYELNQAQYAAFLNALSPQQNTVLSNIGGSMYYQQRGSIKFDGASYKAEFPNRPCNFISWDDAMAYADWAALRPMTEFEFTKAARGTAKPAAASFPWGTISKEKIQRGVNTSGNLVFMNGLDESGLNDTNLEEYAASFYWVMDLAGSLWERVITVGDEKGRQFTGIHGDGQLSNYGIANVINWPLGNNETGGFGFRGGGFYTHDRSYHEFNPFSPVSYRMYGAWSGGARVESYGSRFVRTE